MLDGKPGVYFFNLDAANQLAVWAAKRFYHLPYQRAEMQLQQDGQTIHFDSKRTNANDARLVCSYEPISEPYLAQKGSFDEWITERYCFYTVNKKGIPLRCDILHRPWQLQQAKAEFEQNTILSEQGKVESDVPILHFSKTIEMRAWPLVRG
ncbi:YqjF family protein [Peribacillus faecalis]|uniref:YqjF family protein n=1 Tax=Peribacillus faecalis TaxID=2772559 RepID=UPI0022A69561|nr:DUF2071 domain-containing protein [Peribacillus faecalis]